MISTLTEATLATSDVLMEYLTEEKVAFPKDAKRDALIELARANILKKNPDARKPAPVPAEPEKKQEAPAELSAQDALRMLEAKGFRDAQEVRSALEVVVREGKMAQTQKDALKATLNDIEQREIHMTAREKALEEKAKDVHADMKKQEAAYERLAKIREEMKKEGAAANTLV